MSEAREDGPVSEATSAELRQRMVVRRAMDKMLSGGFHGRDVARDWVEADQEIDEELRTRSRKDGPDPGDVPPAGVHAR